MDLLLLVSGLAVVFIIIIASISVYTISENRKEKALIVMKQVETERSGRHFSL